MGSITPINSPTYQTHSLEAFANPHLLDSKKGKITEDVVAYVLPLFLEGVEFCSLANSNQEWGKVLAKHSFRILKEWHGHSFFKNVIEAFPRTTQPFKVLETVFFDALEIHKPLAEKFGYSITHVSLPSLPKVIDDLNLIAFCEDFNEKPLENINDSLSSYAEKLRIWLKNSPWVSQLNSLDLSGKKLTSLPEEIVFFTGLTDLNLFYNKIRSLPESIGTLSLLREIKTSQNQLTCLPDSIGNLKNLNHFRSFL